MNPQGPEAARQVKYAVVGLGHIAQNAVLPAFRHAKENSHFVALVSGDETKRRALLKKYRKTRGYTYEEYEECLRSPDVEAVYIALPNHLHCDYAVRAARAGKHILCEKPMAVTQADCRKMIDAANANHVRLVIAYRLHFEKANLKAVELAQSGTLGTVRFFESSFSMQLREGDRAYAYSAKLVHRLTIEDKQHKQTFARRDQFAPEIIYFSQCVLDGKEPEPSGHEGLADVRIIEALHRSAQEGRPVRLEPVEKPQGPSREQEIYQPPVTEPRLVHAPAPNG